MSLFKHRGAVETRTTFARYVEGAFEVLLWVGTAFFLVLCLAVCSVQRA